MRKILLLLAAVLVWATSSFAIAETRTASGLVVDVPDGWGLMEKGQRAVVLTSPDKTQSVSITLTPAQGSPETYIADLVKKLGADEPEYDEDGFYTFTFKGNNNSEILGIFGYDEDIFELFFISGEYDDIVENIIDSVDIAE